MQNFNHLDHPITPSIQPETSELFDPSEEVISSPISAKTLGKNTLATINAIPVKQHTLETGDTPIEPSLDSHLEHTEASSELFSTELTKILLSDHPESGLATLQESGLMSAILPEVAVLYQIEQNNPWHLYNVGGHTAKVVAACPPNFHVRMAALLHDIGKSKTKTTGADGIDHFYGHDQVSTEMAREVLQRLQFQNEDSDHICKLISLHDKDIPPTEEGVCRFIEHHQNLSPSEFEELITLKLADNASQNPHKAAARIEKINQTANIYREIITTRPYRISDLVLNRSDVIRINETRRGEKVQLEGPTVDFALQKLLSLVLRHPEANNPDDLTDFLRANLKSIHHATRLPQ